MRNAGLLLLALPEEAPKAAIADLGRTAGGGPGGGAGIGLCASEHCARASLAVCFDLEAECFNFACCNASKKKREGPSLGSAISDCA
eukprot:CAMPEP_0169064352 /NCGR_PEP_ID=MMETSP1015-20121227/1788_1 /TAXON_ID=342587 /ORGANISM="Karlodinium micrum, Strain CCMP2283" /LENGTH=86 /DNA_ID=CAMNT_0009122781 /DNA_START=416 /DNA_END=676 /DNA_ORIENTATION=-